MTAPIPTTVQAVAAAIVVELFKEQVLLTAPDLDANVLALRERAESSTELNDAGPGRLASTAAISSGLLEPSSYSASLMTAPTGRIAGIPPGVFVCTRTGHLKTNASFLGSDKPSQLQTLGQSHPFAKRQSVLSLFGTVPFRQVAQPCVGTSTWSESQSTYTSQLVPVYGMPEPVYDFGQGMRVCAGITETKEYQP